MKVKLIQATENAGKMIADIASICYGKKEAKNPERLLRNLYKLGHGSVFEHAYYTFKIEGISRACLAQLTRHRHASYTVRSQRYSNESYQGVVIPTDIANNFSIQKKYVELLAETQRFYQYLLDNGYKKRRCKICFTTSNIN